MQKKMRLTGIITQGASRMGAAEYIKAFKVASSLDGSVYTTFRVEGQRRDRVRANKALFYNISSQFHSHLIPTFALLLSYVRALQVFTGNTDNDSTKTNLFDPPIVAQYIRIIPVICRRACTLRMELVGCELNGKCTDNMLCGFNIVIKISKSLKRKISKKVDRETNFVQPLRTLYTASIIVKSVVFGWVWYEFFTVCCAHTNR